MYSNPKDPRRRAYQATLDKRRYAECVAAGLCTRCRRVPHADNMLWCTECSTYKKIKSRIKHAAQAPELKLAAFNAYGGARCVGTKINNLVCGESDIDVLSIDHIDGGGNKHRRSLNMKNGGWGFYRWLKKNNYPSGFRVLCMNCQFKAHLTRKRLESIHEA